MLPGFSLIRAYMIFTSILALTTANESLKDSDVFFLLLKQVFCYLCCFIVSFVLCRPTGIIQGSVIGTGITEASLSVGGRHYPGWTKHPRDLDLDCLMTDLVSFRGGP